MPPSSSLPLKQITVILKIVTVVQFLHINLYKPIRSFQSILSSSKLVVPYQSLYLLNLVVRTIFITFFNWQTILFSCAQVINSREATVLLSFVFKDFQQQHCLLRNMIIECHARSDLSRLAQEPIKLLFQVFARYFAFLPAISLFCPLFQ